MKKIVFLILLFFSLSLVNAKEQIFSEFTYGVTNNEYINGVDITEDSGYIVVGFTSSDTLTEVKYNTNRYIGKTSAFITRYDKKNDVVWSRTYDGNNGDVFVDVVSLDDGSFVVVGYTNSTDISGIESHGNIDTILVKYDKDGNLLWQRSYGGKNDDVLQSIISTNDGGFAAVGFSSSDDLGFNYSGITDSILVKFDSNGEFEWHKMYACASYDEFNSLIQDKDGNYYVVGYQRSDNIILKYDKDGELLWARTPGSTSVMGDARAAFYVGDGLMDLTIDEEGNVIAVGAAGWWGIGFDYMTVNSVENRVNTDVSETSVVVRYSPSGEMLEWYHYPDCNGVFTGIEKYEDGYIISGYLDNASLLVDASNGKSAIYLKINNKLEKEWERYYHTTSDARFIDVAVDENRYVVVGHSDSSELNMFTNKGGTDGIVSTFAYLYDATKIGDFTDYFELEDSNNLGKLKLTPDEGFVLGSITIVDSNGNNVDYYEEDGYYYFVMNDDVTVNVTYKLNETNDNEDVMESEKEENPDTSVFSNSMIITLVIAVILYIVSYNGLKKKSID